jgi:nucleoside-diphosphate-sugar epimerase
MTDAARKRVVLLSGASGFIGHHAIAPLQRRGFEVHAVSSREPPQEPVARLATWHRVDLLDPAASSELVERLRPTHLLHLAWYAEHKLFWTSTENVRWVEASLGLLRAFGEAGGQRAVMAGTCAEYEWSTSGPRVEGHSALNPQSLYGVSKDALRRVSEAWCAERGIGFAWGRVFHVFGDREHPERLVASVARAVLKDRPAPCSHGRQLRDFLTTEDAADAFAALLDSSVPGGVNIGSGDATSIGELARRVASSAGNPTLARLGEVPANPSEPLDLTAEVTRLREEVGWTPSLTLAQGVERAVEWHRANLDVQTGSKVAR